MSLLYYILSLRLLISYSYYIINILPYEQKEVEFNILNTYNIFKYKHKTLNNFGNSSFSVRSIGKNDDIEYQFYVYLEEKDINEINGNFINYDKYGNSTDYFIFSECINHDYYIVIKYSHNIKETFYFYSTDTPYEIKNYFYQDYSLFENVNIQSYIFSISNYSKYIKFGLTNYGNSGKSLTQITDKEDNNTIIYEKDSYYFTDSIKLNENITYYFNFSLFYKSASNSMYFLYLMKSNYSKIIEVTKNKLDFDYFPVIDGLYLLLDVSSTPKGSKIIFEYYDAWSYKEFEADGFIIDDLDVINSFYDEKSDNQKYKLSEISKKLKNNLGDIFENNTDIRIPLKVVEEFCDGEICQGYIRKNINGLKKIIFKIPSGGKGLSYIFFRYKENPVDEEEEEEYKKELDIKKYLTKEVFYTFIIGLILASPNLIWLLIRKLRNKMTASRFTLFMNIILNFAYGHIIGYYLKYGKDPSFTLGMLLLLLYIIICVYSFGLQLKGKRGYFDVIFNLCHKFNDSKSLNEMISFNRKLCPSIKVGCVAQHEESREVWEEEEEYDKAIYKTETDEDGVSREVLDHYEKAYRHVKTHYSPWGRVDKGGGHFNGIPGSSRNRYIEKTEYRTVETWRKEEDYIYKSWQDDTKCIENIKFCSIVEATFSYNISFDQESKNIISEMKNKLYAKGKTYDTDVRTYDIFTVPGFCDKHICPLNEGEYQRIQKKFANPCGYIFWLLFFILGYSSIFEAYSRYEIGKENIILYKYVSSQNNMRMPYKMNEVDLPAISISFVHTKLQMKSLEKKLEKGKIEIKDMDIPLIYVN